MATETKSKRLDLRVRPDEDELIRAAAAERSQTVSEFLVESALERAEVGVTERTRFVLNAKQWAAFMADLDRPPEANPRLADLFNRT